MFLSWKLILNAVMVSLLAVLFSSYEFYLIKSEQNETISQMEQTQKVMEHDAEEAHETFNAQM